VFREIGVIQMHRCTGLVQEYRCVGEIQVDKVQE
jgi:hypothetical protein